jgi:fluoroacetyl-CoA thioesterase
MNQGLKPGITLTLKKIIGPDDTAVMHGSGLLEVFATPAMIAFMERAAMELVSAHLEEGETTVGTAVQVRHLRASSVGTLVSCTATLSNVEGRKLDFEVLAEDDQGTIGHGIHTRFVIQTAQFLERLENKKG